MSPARLLLCVLGAASVLLTSCQTNRALLPARLLGHAAPLPTSIDTAASVVVLLHDSQGPQATRALLTKAEVLAWQKQEK